MKRSANRLSLATETLRVLQVGSLDRVHGMAGGARWSRDDAHCTDKDTMKPGCIPPAPTHAGDCLP
jgi:hypothetical protein